MSNIILENDVYLVGQVGFIPKHDASLQVQSQLQSQGAVVAALQVNMSMLRKLRAAIASASDYEDEDEYPDPSPTHPGSSLVLRLNSLLWVPFVGGRQTGSDALCHVWACSAKLGDYNPLQPMTV